MEFKKTQLADAVIIELKKIHDDRGFFARTWCEKELAKQGISSRLVQANVSFNRLKGTLRGLHLQISPYQEAKFVRCVRGAIYDVIIDLRPSSPSYRQWVAVELTGSNHRMIYVPEGFAHGFQSLEDDTEVQYGVSAAYAPQAERGMRYDDPAFSISWPLAVTSISGKDRSWPDYLEHMIENEAQTEKA